MNLYDFQKDALAKMKDGCILHGGVGSGKSLVSVVWYYKQMGGNISKDNRTPLTSPLDLYVITTAKKRDSCEWLKELAPFGLTPLDKDGRCSFGNKVVIDSWNNIKKYENVANSYFIFDEQRVVGSGTWVKAFLKIAKSNRWILLSATPGDTWMDYVPIFIANGFYRNKHDFVTQHVVYRPFTSFPQVDRYVNIRRLERLRDLILVDMNRPKELLVCEESCVVDYDKNAYKFILGSRYDPWKDEPIQNASGLAYCLRRVVNQDESRQVKLLELFEKHPKIIVFYSFDYELDILLKLGYPEGTEIAQWNGHKHQEIPAGNKWVYLVQYTSGCEGWNCLKTDTIVFYSQQYSYRVFEQAKGRIDRLNTPFTTLYYYIFKSQAGIDLAINKAINTKKTFNAGRYFGKIMKENGSSCS